MGCQWRLLSSFTEPPQTEGGACVFLHLPPSVSSWPRPGPLLESQAESRLKAACHIKDIKYQLSLSHRCCMLLLTQRSEDKAPGILQSPCLCPDSATRPPHSVPSHPLLPFMSPTPTPPPLPPPTSPLFFLLPCYFISTCHKSVPPQSSCHLCSGPLCVAVLPEWGRRADNHRLIECL